MILSNSWSRIDSSSSMCFEGITTASGFDSKPLSINGLGAGSGRDEAPDIVDEGSIVVVQKGDERHRGYYRGVLYITVMGDTVSVDHPARNWSTVKSGMTRQCILSNTDTKLIKKKKNLVPAFLVVNKEEGVRSSPWRRSKRALHGPGNIRAAVMVTGQTSDSFRVSLSL